MTIMARVMLPFGEKVSRPVPEKMPRSSTKSTPSWAQLSLGGVSVNLWLGQLSLLQAV